MFKKIYVKIRLFLLAFASSGSGVNKLLSTSQKDTDEIKLNQNLSKGTVMDDLINGEITQQVKEFRHMVYAVAEESENYSIIKSGDDVLRIKIDRQFLQIPKIYNPENSSIELIHQNDIITLSIDQSTDVSNNFFDETKTTINVNRDFIPRFKIENFITKLVLKELKDSSNGERIMDLYVSKYTDKNSRNHISQSLFLTELNKLKENYSLKTEITDFSDLSFKTLNTWGVRNMLLYEISNKGLIKIDEFDGSYVLSFNCKINSIKDLREQYFCKEMQEKYDNKTLKEWKM